MFQSTVKIPNISTLFNTESIWTLMYSQDVFCTSSWPSHGNEVLWISKWRSVCRF